ncbi:hypothetical protein ES708_14025 [subsurface metagenome]
MTANTVPAILDSVLDPLNAIQEDVQAALLLAQQNKLPRPFLQTIQAAITDIERTWETLNEICTTLDPDRAKPEP